MVGFGPVIFTMLVWLGLRHRGAYRQLRTAADLDRNRVAVLPPAADRPAAAGRGLGIADTVGLAGHDSGSFAGIKFNPYAAMPSMHVGWSLLVGLIGFRVARRRLAARVFLLHPVIMAITVTATGNHYFLDSIVGILVALSAVALLRLPRPRLGSLRLRPALVTPCSSR